MYCFGSARKLSGSTLVAPVVPKIKIELKQEVKRDVNILNLVPFVPGSGRPRTEYSFQTTRLDLSEKRGESDKVGKRSDPPVAIVPPVPVKRQKIDEKQTERNNEQNVDVKLSNANVYDSVSGRLIRCLDEWILNANQQLIQKFIGDIKAPYRTCDVFCLIGPTGSGKSCVVKHALNQIGFRWITYDEFADVGRVTSEKEPGGHGGGSYRHGCHGFLSTLSEDVNPFVLVIDGPDGETHKDFQELLIKEYGFYQHYRQPNKSIVLLVQSLDTFELRDWIRKIGAYKYYVSTSLKYQEQEFLRQRIHSLCPLRSTEPIQRFIGDFRRMGIDLISCTEEGAIYYRNTNQSTCRSLSIFEMTQHLTTWPMDVLHRPIVNGDALDKLFVMCASNQLQRAGTSDGFNELAHVAADLSDIEVLRSYRFDDDGTNNCLLITPKSARTKPEVDCDRYDILSLVHAMYDSNRRLGSHLRPAKTYKIQFARSVFHGQKKSGLELDNLQFNRFKVDGIKGDEDGIVDNFIREERTCVDTRPEYWK